MKFNKKVLNSMVEMNESGSDKNEILGSLIIDHGLEYNDLEKYWKESGLQGSRTGSGYRQRTLELFNENPELDIEEWDDVMISEGLLKSTKNYRQLFPLFYSLYNKTPMK